MTRHEMEMRIEHSGWGTPRKPHHALQASLPLVQAVAVGVVEGNDNQAALGKRNRRETSFMSTHLGIGSWGHGLWYSLRCD